MWWEKEDVIDTADKQHHSSRHLLTRSLRRFHLIIVFIHERQKKKLFKIKIVLLNDEFVSIKTVFLHLLPTYNNNRHKDLTKLMKISHFFSCRTAVKLICMHAHEFLPSSNQQQKLLRAIQIFMFVCSQRAVNIFLCA